MKPRSGLLLSQVRAFQRPLKGRSRFTAPLWQLRHRGDAGYGCAASHKDEGCALIPGPIDAIGEFSRRFRNADVRFHEIRLSDFANFLSDFIRLPYRKAGILSCLRLPGNPFHQRVEIFKSPVLDDHLAAAMIVVDGDFEAQRPLQPVLRVSHVGINLRQSPLFLP